MDEDMSPRLLGLGVRAVSLVSPCSFGGDLDG